jgi:hypothetical protein
MRPSLAMLVSALAHIGAAVVLTSQPSQPAATGAVMAETGPALTVWLIASPRLAAPLAAPAAPAAAPEVAAMEPMQQAADAANASSPHYFGASAMTQEPVVSQGLIAGRLLVVPGVAPQTVALKVWISDQGAVERVALDSPIHEEDEQKLLAAFADVKFHPGRIGRIAVRSHLAMEIMLDDAVRL